MLLLLPLLLLLLLLLLSELWRRWLTSGLLSGSLCLELGLPVVVVVISVVIVPVVVVVAAAAGHRTEGCGPHRLNDGDRFALLLMGSSGLLLSSRLLLLLPSGLLWSGSWLLWRRWRSPWLLLLLSEGGSRLLLGLGTTLLLLLLSLATAVAGAAAAAASGFDGAVPRTAKGTGAAVATVACFSVKKEN